MSEQITIICPQCGFSKVIPKSAIPDSVDRASCPKCQLSFALNDETMRAAATPPPFSSVMDSGSAPPIPPVSSHASLQLVPRTLAFTFEGSARDYFGIWIVNTLLKIVTVGIYSAWAKVRQRRFFYGSTTLHGQPFEYLADPLALFKGWLIAAVAFILYGIATRVSPLLSMAVALVVFLVFPWLVVRSRMFNSVNSSYRNIRFGFRPDYRQSYVVFAGLTILSLLTLGLLMPYTLYRQKKFMVENSSYGATPFTFSATVKDFYLLSLKVALGFIAIFGLIGLMAGLSGSGLASAVAAGGAHGAWRGLVLVPALALPLVYFMLTVYGQTALANLCWNGTSMGSNRFRSTLRTRDMALLFVTNALAIMFSLGLMMPWATVRLARYRFEHLQLETMGGLDGLVAAAGSGAAVGAAGEEIGDVFGMTIDIAL